MESLAELVIIAVSRFLRPDRRFCGGHVLQKANLRSAGGFSKISKGPAEPEQRTHAATGRRRGAMCAMYGVKESPAAARVRRRPLPT
jgi:hypothetical protein